MVNDTYLGFELVILTISCGISNPFTSLFSDTAHRNVTRPVMSLICGSLELLLDPGTASTSSGFAWDDLTLYRPQEDRGINVELKKNTIDPSGFQQYSLMQQEIHGTAPLLDGTIRKNQLFLTISVESIAKLGDSYRQLSLGYRKCYHARCEGSHCFPLLASCRVAPVQPTGTG